MQICMKVSDISNEARPLEVAIPWLDCLLKEFFNQVFKMRARDQAMLRQTLLRLGANA